ncbi:Epsin-2 [Glycine soja]
MGSLFLGQIKKQTSTFLQEKYKSARMAFTDVSEAEMLAEEATNKDDCCPHAKTMTRIAEASFDVDEYWRIVDVLHKRLYNIDWDQWKQSYKALVLLEFLLTHGTREFAQEFQCDAEIIEELGIFTHIDKKGFNWGSRMLKLSEQILKLLQDEEALIEARLKALKITNEIQGFGSSLNSPTSSSPSPCSLSSEASQGSSCFYSFSTTSTPTYIFDSNDQLNKHHSPSIANDGNINIVLPPKNVTKNHVWKRLAGEENNILIDSDEDEDMEKPRGFVSEICSKIIGGSPIKGDNREKIEFRCLSDVGSKVTQKKFDRQYSIWF